MRLQIALDEPCEQAANEFEHPIVVYSVSYFKQQLSLIDIINADKIHDHWFEDLDYFHEYDTDTEEPGVYTATLTLHSWQGYEGDWDCEIIFNNITKVVLDIEEK